VNARAERRGGTLEGRRVHGAVPAAFLLLDGRRRGFRMVVHVVSMVVSCIV
jgi:hypothetical protein